MTKHRKIVDVNFDGENLHLDLRVSIPRKNLSTEFIKDVVEMKHSMINGSFHEIGDKSIAYLQYTASVVTDENGKDTISIEKNALEFNK